MHRNCLLNRVLMLWTTISITVIECNNIKGQLPQTSLITNFVKNFIQPYLLSLQAPDEPQPRASNEIPVKKVIKHIIHNLRPLLQDDDRINDNTRAQDETTIIEFVPHPDSLRKEKEPNIKLKTKVQKYEKLKNEIKKALDKESVSESTKNMVIRTLDNLIKQVIKNQCSWNNVNHSSAVLRTRNGVKHSITAKEWGDLSKRYIQILESKDKSDKNASLKIFQEFDNFFLNVINETQSLSNKYKIKCQLYSADADEIVNNSIARQDTEDNSCKDFKVCSEEMKEFLLDFYKNLNETTVSVFKNYAAMYARDVGDDNESTESVPEVLETMGNAAERRVSRIFIQDLNTLKLDPKKDKEANIKILKDFVEVTVSNTIKHIKKHLSNDLMTLRARLLTAVKQDLTINLDVDLGNQETDIKNRICTVFVTCNGRVLGNRRSNVKPDKHLVDSNSVYVKVKINLNDKLKDTIFRTNRGLFSSIAKPQSRKDKKNHKHLKDYRRYSNINVTRTTVLTTTSTENNSNDIFEYYLTSGHNATTGKNTTTKNNATTENNMTTEYTVTTGNLTTIRYDTMEVSDYIKNSVVEKYK